MTHLEVGNTPHLSDDFDSARSKIKSKKKRRSPLSVRMSDEQWEQFEQDAIGMSLNAYALSCFFDKGAKAKGKQSKHDKAVASALRRMGALGLGTFITCQITALNKGRLILSKHDEAALRKADIEFHRLRCDLVQALGMESEYKK